MLNSRARQLAADRRYEYFMPAHVIGIEGKGMADLQFTILTKAIVAIGCFPMCGNASHGISLGCGRASLVGASNSHLTM